MQKKMDQPLMFQNAQLYIYGVLFNGAHAPASERRHKAQNRR